MTSDQVIVYVAGLVTLPVFCLVLWWLAGVYDWLVPKYVSHFKLSDGYKPPHRVWIEHTPGLVPIIGVHACRHAVICRWFGPKTPGKYEPRGMAALIKPVRRPKEQEPA